VPLAGRSWATDDEIIALFSRIAENVSFALDNFDRAAEKARADEATLSLTRMYAALSATNEAIMRAKTRAIDKLRSMRRRGQTFVAPLDERVARGPETRGDDPALAAEDRSLAQGALEQLPGPQRQAIELAFYGGLTQAEIAARLGEPLGTVKTRMRLGLERLRALFKADEA